jgi:hypothetical protein
MKATISNAIKLRFVFELILSLSSSLQVESRCSKLDQSRSKTASASSCELPSLLTALTGDCTDAIGKAQTVPFVILLTFISVSQPAL